MQKISTMRTSGKNIFQGQLTIGLDLGDRSSAYCVLNEAGEIVLARIKHDLLAAGFTDIDIEMVELSTRLNSCDAAQGLVFGSPLRAEIERRDPSSLDRAAEAVAQALVQWDGKDAPMSAHLVTARTCVAT
jgi:hypothetical protein